MTFPDGQPDFLYPLQIGNRWEYRLTLKDDPDTLKTLEAAGKYLGLDLSDSNDVEIKAGETGILRVIDVIDDKVSIQPLKSKTPVDVFLLHTTNYNSQGERKFAKDHALWVDYEGLKQLNFFSVDAQDADAKALKKSADSGKLSKLLGGICNRDDFYSDDLARYLGDGQLLLKFPVKAGLSWDIDRIVGQEELLTPAGWFDCWMVERMMNLYGESRPVRYAFASAVGLVRLETPLYTLELDKYELKD